MSEKTNNVVDRPELISIENALNSEYKKRRGPGILSVIIGFLLCIIIVGGIAIALTCPIVHVYGTAMKPAIPSDCFVLCLKTGHYGKGDILAFYHDDKTLIRRIEVLPGFAAQMEDGNMQKISKGEYFVLADNDADQDNNDDKNKDENKNQKVYDSRNQDFGCVKEEDIIGKVAFILWPLQDFGFTQ